MKAFRLVLDPGGIPASPLHFLDRGDASQYQKILLWPWKVLGYFQSADGAKWPLEGLRFRVEPALLPGIHDPALDWVLWRNQNVLGYVPLIPGRCFDPESWRAIQDQDLRDPILAPQIAEAERQLDAQTN
jgi:hypothetical protein